MFRGSGLGIEARRAVCTKRQPSSAGLGIKMYGPGTWLTVELVPQSFLRANGVSVLVAVAVGMLESRHLARFQTERWKQTFPPFPRA